MPTSPSPRMPAEWERHRATWIAWPHEESDFPGKLSAVQWVYPEIVRVLAESEQVEILCEPGSGETINEMLVKNGVHTSSFRIHPIPTDRSWLRDSLPTFIKRGDVVEAIAWRFNAWAKYENHLLDAELPEEVTAITNTPLTEARRPDNGERFVAEGGGIETDGEGTLLVTEECFLSTIQQRNPGLDRAGYERVFSQYLGITKTIWLGAGCVGDDTHGHIDDIARFSAPGEILLAVEDDRADSNYAASQENYRRLQSATDARGRRLKIRKLPFPSPVIFNEQQLPASYANFYISNSAVLVPTFNDPRDREALLTIAEAFPGRKVVGIHSRDLVWGLGTIHCLTQQEPAA